MTQHSIATRRLLYFLLLITTALIIFSQSTHPQRHWLIWSSLFLSLVTQGDTFLQRQTIITLTALACLLSVWLAANAHIMPFALAIILLFITMTCVYFSQRYTRYSLAFFIINLFALLSGCFPPPHHEEAQCLLFISEGAAMTLLFQFLFWPGYKKGESSALFLIAMQSLKNLNQDIFACFLQSDYADNKYQYEKRLHDQKMRFMQTISQSKKIGKKLAGELTTIFEILLDCAQLRGRVSDFSIFQVCATELAAIFEAMDKLFLATAPIDTERLNDCIQRLEESYQHVLSVTAKEPLPFMLFIASLRAFSQSIGSLE